MAAHRAFVANAGWYVSSFGRRPESVSVAVGSPVFCSDGRLNRSKWLKLLKFLIFSANIPYNNYMGGFSF